VDFLVKPVDIDELAAAVEKVKHLKEQQPKTAGEDFKKQIENIIMNINAMHTPGAAQKPLRIMLHLHEGYAFVNCEELMYLESDGPYSKFHIDNEPTITVSKPSSKFQDVLAAAGFIRIHRTYTVNPAFIKRYLREDDQNSSSYILMKNGEKLEVSRRKKTEVLEQLHKYNHTSIEI